MVRYDYSELEKLIEEGFSLTEISEKLEIPLCTLWRHCDRSGTSYKRKKRIERKERKEYRTKYNYSQVKSLAEQGFSLNEISQNLNIPYPAVYNYCKIRGISCIKKSKYDYSQVHSLAEQGFSLREISEQLNIPYYSIYNYSQIKGISLAKKSKYDYNKIRELAKQGYCLKEVSKKLNVSYCYLSQIASKHNIYFLRKNGIKKTFAMESNDFREFDPENAECSKCFVGMYLEDGLEWQDTKYVFCKDCEQEIIEKLLKVSNKIIQIKQWKEKFKLSYNKYTPILNKTIEELNQAVKVLE
jgi:hypothetical protein